MTDTHHWIREEQMRRALDRMAEKETALAAVVTRDACFRCGVRAEMHEIHGCRRYTA